MRYSLNRENKQLLRTSFDKENFTNHRSSRRRCSARKDVLRNFAKFTGKHLCQSLFFNKVWDLRPTTLLKRIWPSCFPVNLAKFLRILFSQSTSAQLLLVQTRHLWRITFYVSARFHDKAMKNREIILTHFRPMFDLCRNQ